MGQFWDDETFINSLFVAPLPETVEEPDLVEDTLNGKRRASAIVAVHSSTWKAIDEKEKFVRVDQRAEHSR
jgi:hypothetical protein